VPLRRASEDGSAGALLNTVLTELRKRPFDLVFRRSMKVATLP
jgi:hypothetical protein